MMDKKVLADLIQGCQKGNEKAQSTFYTHYKRKLLGICRRYARTTFEAEDIFQDAFIKVFLKIGDVTHPEAIDYWIKSIVVRTAIDHYRKNSPFWFTQDIEKPGILPDDTDPFDVLDALEKEEVMAALQTLPDGYRLVFNLYLIDGFEHHEIAEMTGISTSTSKSQLSRAKAFLRKNLTQKGINSYEKG